MSVNTVPLRSLLLILLGIMVSESVFAVSGAQASSDYLVGSGLSSIGRLETAATGIAIVAGLILSIWAIISALRALGAGNGGLIRYADDDNSWMSFATFYRSSDRYDHMKDLYQ